VDEVLRLAEAMNSLTTKNSSTDESVTSVSGCNDASVLLQAATDHVVSTKHHYYVAILVGLTIELEMTPPFTARVWTEKLNEISQKVNAIFLSDNRTRGCQSVTTPSISNEIAQGKTPAAQTYLEQLDVESTPESVAMQVDSERTLTTSTGVQIHYRLPAPPIPAISFSNRVDQLFVDWYSSCHLVLDGHGIPIRDWVLVYKNTGVDKI
jgi:hypothetical protein